MHFLIVSVNNLNTLSSPTSRPEIKQCVSVSAFPCERGGRQLNCAPTDIQLDITCREVTKQASTHSRI